MATDSGYEKGNYLRVCDICGHRFHFRDLTPIGELRFACPDDAPGLTSIQISRFNARARPLVVRPNKWAKDYSQTSIYQIAEAEIFNLIAAVAPKDSRDGNDDGLSAAWSSVYMAEILIQDKRATIWTRTALETITRCLAFLRTQQYGDPTGIAPTAAIDAPRYGGILAGANYSTKVTIAAGVAFLKAYQATGTVEYLLAAERCATFIRHVQCGDLQITAYVVFPSGGGRYHSGGLAEGVVSATGLLQTTYRTADVAALWFLSLLGAVQGTGTYYGDAAATAFFSAPTRATIATMMSELSAFGEDGVRVAGTVGLVPGLLITAPRDSYQAAVNGVSGGAAWTSITTILADDICLALLGLYMANGNDAKVQEVIAWLQTFASNVNNRTPATMSEIALLESIVGTYDSTLCVADELVAAAPFQEADGALYSWAALGLLAPILALVEASFRRSKDQLSVSQRYSYFDNHEKFLGPIGSSGLSLQPFGRDSAGVAISVGGGPTGSSSTSSSAVTPPVVGDPPTTGLVLWWEGGRSVITTGLDLNGDDRMIGMTNLVYPINGHCFAPIFGFGDGPFVGLDTQDGHPSLTWRIDVDYTQSFHVDNLLGTGVPQNLKDRSGNIFGHDPGECQAFTVVAVITPLYDVGHFFSDITGGVVCGFGRLPVVMPMLMLEDNTDPNAFYAFSCSADPRANLGTTRVLQGPDTAGGVAGIYNGTPMICEWSSSGGTDISFYINNVAVPLTPAVQDLAEATGIAYICGNRHPGDNRSRFKGTMTGQLIWDYKLASPERDELYEYLSGRYPSIGGLTPVVSLPSNLNIVRAAQTGMVYRQNPGRYPALRGN